MTFIQVESRTDRKAANGELKKLYNHESNVHVASADTERSTW